MLGLLQGTFLGAGLTVQSRTRLELWMKSCETGGGRLRAGIPAGWPVGDKTGSGGYGETNDVAIVWPPKRPPIIIAAYYAGSSASSEARDAVLASVGAVAARQ